VALWDFPSGGRGHFPFVVFHVPQIAFGIGAGQERGRGPASTEANEEAILLLRAFRSVRFETTPERFSFAA
jgi:hypothetical protein